MQFIKNIIHKDPSERGGDRFRRRGDDVGAVDERAPQRSLLSTYVMGSMLLVHRKLRDGMPKPFTNLLIRKVTLARHSPFLLARSLARSLTDSRTDSLTHSIDRSASRTGRTST